MRPRSTSERYCVETPARSATSASRSPRCLPLGAQLGAHELAPQGLGGSLGLSRDCVGRQPDDLSHAATVGRAARRYVAPFCSGLNLRRLAGVTLRIVRAAPDYLEEWRGIHNAIIPTAPLSGKDIAERATRNRLTLGYDGDLLVGNATVRPPGEAGTATVIVRILPRTVAGSRVGVPRTRTCRGACLAPKRIETVVLASNTDGLAFALARGFVEVVDSAGRRHDPVHRSPPHATRRGYEM